MKINFDSSGDDAQIQIIPLIDVIFCILTFFILAALQLTRQQGINLDLPRASTSNVQMRETLVVTIDSTGQTFVDTQLINRAQLFQVVKNYNDQRPDGLLVLRASQTAFYNDVIQVLDILRAVGGDRVALATEPTTQVPGQSPDPTAPGSQSPLIPAPGLPGSPASPINPNGLQPVPTDPNQNQSIPGQLAPLPNQNQSIPGQSDPLPNQAPANPVPGQSQP
ncbi:ExbD/TolR family protein [Myxacorys almedinensis]|uniref:Biopolymer transporter ExbD n=1 Tax=Myxacorys almedinensis A TaxID=2690445 RepID=A0A8J7Z508_9CYAN|nr:biopolymer transporter ExbD [Myxacorys almedinensis]NDJ16543.1 biopolymer transporter ExbD [Myxacorys almedinensis A]